MALTVRDLSPGDVAAWIADHHAGRRALRALGSVGDEALDLKNRCATDSSWAHCDALAVLDGAEPVALVAWEVEDPAETSGWTGKPDAPMAVIRLWLYAEGAAGQRRAIAREAIMALASRYGGNVGGWCAQDNAQTAAALAANGAVKTDRTSLAPYDFWVLP